MTAKSDSLNRLQLRLPGDPLEGHRLLRLVLFVQPEDVPRHEVPLAQASAQRHLQSSSWTRYYKINV
jgi:hypothetical protein